jgi:Trypsin-like peptidase domain
MDLMAENQRKIYDLYKTCMVRIETIGPDKEIHNGAGFHVGNGIIVTAQHVVDYELNKLVAEYLRQEIKVHKIHRHPDELVDLAVLETNFNIDDHLKNVTYQFTDGTKQSGTERHSTFIPIGDHLDDWIGDELILSEVLLMGYPRIPLSRAPVLTAAVGHVNAIIDRYIGPHPFFIVSCMARGGFSGGPAITEYGVLLGVITSSFVANNQELELGFNGVITIEPLLSLLADHQLRPTGVHPEIWDIFTSPPE